MCVFGSLSYVFLNFHNYLFVLVIYTYIQLFGGHSWSLCTLHGNSVVGLYKTVSEFLLGTLGDHNPLPEVRDEIAVSLGNGIKSGFGVIAQDASSASG